MQPAQQPRSPPALVLPPYSYVPGHDLPHPVNDPAGHLAALNALAPEPPLSPAWLATLPTESSARRRALAAELATNARWIHALNLFNGGWYWESHESWEAFWHALGRTTPEAQFVQGLIHLAAACVKVREGKPNGVARHTTRARELLDGHRAAPDGGDTAGPSGDQRGSPADAAGALGLAPDSLAAVVAELGLYKPECWHASRAPVVRVLAGELRLVDEHHRRSP